MMIMPVLNSDSFTLLELRFEKNRYIYSVYWRSAMTPQKDNKIAGYWKFYVFNSELA